MEGKGNFSTRAFAWRSRNRNSKEKESDQTHGSFRKRFGELRRSKRSDEDASSIDVSDSPQSDSRRILMASSKLPCQAFGSAQSQVYPQDNVPSLNKRDRFSRSARQHGERRRVSDERRRMSDVGTVTERNGECIEFPRGLYKKFDMLSCSSRHPEMVCSMFNTGFTKESRGFIRDELQNHDISFLKAPADVGSSQLRRSEARTAESGSAEISQKCDNARGQGHRIFFASEASHSERFSQTASQDRKGVENDQCGKSGDNRLGDKYLKFSKHSLALHSTEEARSRTAALHQWLKHILKRKGSQSLKNEEQEKYHRHFKQQPRLNRKIQASDQALCRSAHPYGKDVQDSRMPEEIIHSSSEGVHLKRGLFITRSKTNKTFFNNQELMPQLQRSSSVPHSESCYMYQSIHADMPRRSEASAASLRRLPIIEFEELQTCESEEVLLPPRRHRESIHKRSFFTDKLAVSPFQDVAKTVEKKSHVGLDDIECLNNFLRGQRMKISNVPAGEESARVKIILSGPDLSLSSMVAAICYAWLLEYTENHGGWNPVPVINTTRWSMWEHRQVAWLFHHSGLDARALFFCDEVDLETLVHARQLNIVVIGQDALKTNDEVASLCTVLVEDYKGHAHDLLQLPYIRKLLLAGILLDTQNLDSTAVFFTARDRAAVDLLLVGVSPYHRYTLFGQLNREHNDSSFEEALQYNYGEHLNTEIVEEGDEEEDEEILPQKIESDSVALMAPAKEDLTGVLQLEDESRSSNATMIDAGVCSQPESSLPKSAISQMASASASGVKVKINWTVARWFGFGSRQQSVKT